MLVSEEFYLVFPYGFLKHIVLIQVEVLVTPNFGTLQNFNLQKCHFFLRQNLLNVLAEEELAYSSILSVK